MREEEEENVHAMVACIIQLPEQLLRDLHQFRPPPSNTLPKLNFELDADGFLWILPPIWGVNDNGVIGYGRFVK